LSTVDGDQVPVIPLSDIVGNVGTGAPGQIVRSKPKLNTGTIVGLTVTAKDAEVPHCPAEGVKI